MPMRLSPLLLPLLLVAAPARAADDQLEAWFNPTVTGDLDRRHFVEIEVQQRFRPAPSPDLGVGRLWVGRRLGRGVTAMIGLHRGTEGAVRENRLMQHLSYPLGGRMVGRTRLEQRMFEGGARTAWRLRQRVGGTIPLGGEAGWALAGNVEGFLTMRAARSGGDRGLTGLRLYGGVERDIGRARVGLGYTRQQTIVRGAPDRIGHAPTLGLILKL